MTKSNESHNGDHKNQVLALEARGREQNFYKAVGCS